MVGAVEATTGKVKLLQPEPLANERWSMGTAVHSKAEKDAEHFQQNRSSSLGSLMKIEIVLHMVCFPQ